ncbi:hypothetical protein IT570_06390 [Candidatus Sumerlaeota bacterium]|nr:hypothetical protein [Candidatus Sumerlaeota bacterium]
MKAFRFVIHTALLLVVAGGVPTMIFSTVWLRQEKEKAQVQYQETSRDYRIASKRYDQLEGKLRSLTQNVDAVQEEVREQFRMVKAGESLAVIRYEGVADAHPDPVPPHPKPVKVVKHH